MIVIINSNINIIIIMHARRQMASLPPKHVYIIII